MELRSSMHSQSCFSLSEAAFRRVMPVGHVVTSQSDNTFQCSAKEYA